MYIIKNLKSICFFNYVAIFILKVKSRLNIVSKEQFDLKFVVLSRPYTCKAI